MSQPNPKEQFQSFFTEHCIDQLDDLAANYPNETRSLYIDCSKLKEEYPDLARRLKRDPELIDAASEALQEHQYANSVEDGFEGVHIRLKNLDSHTEIRNLRARDLNTVVSLKGVVRSASAVKPKMQIANYQCLQCLEELRIHQGDRQMNEPNACPSCDSGGPLELQYQKSSFIDGQIIQVQESPEGLRGGETPEEINVPIEDDIAGIVTPGDHITVTGVLRLEKKQDIKGESPTFDTYMEGHSIELEDEKFDEMDISDEDIVEIHEESDHPNVYRRLVDSMAPSIYGYDDIKQAIIFQLFSGVTKHLPDGSRIRGDIHILIIGDPGTGKSKLLQYVRNIAPRAVYSSGKGSSSAGLTAAAVQKDLGDGSEWTLEAGTLVLADGGIAAIDELDKMSADDRSALHEGLEQGEISIAKAGINATLKSRCSLLAAANPKHGRFEKYSDNITEQIDLEPALVSRFDLIFKVKDEPDREKDDDMATSILASNKVGQKTVRKAFEREGTSNIEAASINYGDMDAEEEDSIPTISNELLRKYIAHAQQVCYPELTDEAEKKIRNYYVDLRNPEDANEDDPVPATARKLEGMVRLSEASTRIRLDDTITIDDVNRAVHLVETSMRDVALDPETGEFDADMVESGQSKTQRDRVSYIQQIINDLDESEEEFEDGVPLDVIKDEAKDRHGIDPDKTEHTVRKQTQSGSFYDPLQQDKFKVLD